MASTVELMHLCRLCLVKEQVNVPIFEEQDQDSQIFMKIATCLPVKINKEDKLPKNICGGCSYKLDLFYQFCNSTTNAEKQLLQWFNKVGFAGADGVDRQPEAAKDLVDEAQVDAISTETQSYILQQQQLPYGPVEFFQGDFDESQPASGVSESEIIEETVSKKRKRATKTVSNKKSKSVVTSKTDGSDEDDDVNDTNEMAFEDSKFSISCDRDVEQAGPSGIGKPDPPFPDTSLDIYKKYERVYGLRKCVVLLGDLENIDKSKYSLVKQKRKKLDTLNHVNIIDSPRTKYKCSRCNERFQDYQILQSHKDVCTQKEDEALDTADEFDDYKYHKRLRSSTSSAAKATAAAKTVSQEAITTNTTTTTSEATTTSSATPVEANDAADSAEAATSNTVDADSYENKFLCKCGKSFSMNTFNSHTKICRVYTMAKNTDHFQCKNCHRFIYSLQFHNHTCAPAPKWNCHDCDVNFKSFYELVQHYKDHKHSMICSMCLKECTSYGSLAAHKMSCTQKYAAKITFAETSSGTTTITTVDNVVLASCKASKLPAETKTTTSNKTKMSTSGKTKSKTCKICNVVLSSDEKLKQHTCVAPSTAATTTTTKCDLCSVRLPPEALISHIESHFSIVQVKNASEDNKVETESHLLLSELDKIITSDAKDQNVTSSKTYKCAVCNKIEMSENKLVEHMKEHVTVHHKKPRNENAAKAKCKSPTSSAKHPVRPREILAKPADMSGNNINNPISARNKVVPLLNNQNQPKLFLIMTPTGGASTVTPVYATMSNLNMMTQSTLAMQSQQNLSTIPTTQMPLRIQVTPSNNQVSVANGISNFVISEVTSGPAAQSMIERQSPATAKDTVEDTVSSNGPAIEDSIDALTVAVANNEDEIDEDSNAENDEDLSENVIDPNYKPKIFVKPLSQLLKSPVKMIVNEAVNGESEKQNVDVGEVKTVTEVMKVIKQVVPKADGTVTNVVQGVPQKIDVMPVVKTIIEVVNPSTSMMPKISLLKTKGVKKFYRCSICNILQRKSIKLEQHQKKYACRLCPYYCCKLVLMDKHYRDVHNYKNRCPLCDKQFPTRQFLSAHKKEHLCPHCGRSFANLTKHAKAFKCKSCKFEACTNTILDKHYKQTHCVMMRCTPCNEVFYSDTTFTAHKVAIHFCKKCKTFKMDLNIHQTFCKGIPTSDFLPVLNTPQVIISPKANKEADVIEVVDSD